MSLMCSMKVCTEQKGLCLHEKVMFVIVVFVGLGAMGHWVFNWY